jgi:hypothetical protein
MNNQKGRTQNGQNNQQNNAGNQSYQNRSSQNAGNGMGGQSGYSNSDYSNGSTNSGSNSSQSNLLNAQDEQQRKTYLNNLKQETAQELNIDLNNENMTTRDAGRLGGNMVRKMIEQVKSGNNQMQ